MMAAGASLASRSVRGDDRHRPDRAHRRRRPHLPLVLLAALAVALGAPPHNAAAAGGAAPVALAGTLPVLNIMCKFADVAAEPKDTAYFNALVSEASPGLGHYWREVSGGAISLAGSASTGWLVLPRPRAAYVGTETNLELLYLDCRQRAVAAGHDPSAFAVLNLLFNAHLSCTPVCGAWGSPALHGERVTWLHPDAYAKHAWAAHEMGHALGLHHSNFDGGPPQDNSWDIMSGFEFANGVPDPVLGTLGWHTIAYHKDALGWIPAARKLLVPPGATRTIRLERSALPLTADYLMIQVAAGAGRFFTVEARRPAGYDAGKGDAVIIHEVIPERTNAAGAPEPAWVMGSDGGGGAAWTVGETFSDKASGTSVRVDEATASGFVVTVSSGLKVLTVTRSGLGRVIGPGIACGTGAGGDCSEAYLPGAVVTLTATAYTNTRTGEIWTFDHWEGACTGTARTCTVTMSAARSVKAVFLDLSA